LVGAHFLRDRAKDLGEIIKKNKQIHIVTHIDADGITSGAIAVQTLKRLGIDYSIEFVKQLDKNKMEKLIDKNHDLVWFTDLGSSFSDKYPDMNKIITDHHVCPKDTNFKYHLNPHLFNIDGSYEISGAGATYLVSKYIDKKNMDLSGLAIVGACGDLQDRRYGKLVGINREILSDGIKQGILRSDVDLRYFGRETRPVYKLLQYSNDPLIPGITGRESSCIKFLENNGIQMKDEDNWRCWIDLCKDEKRKIISSIGQTLLNKGFGYKITQRIIGEVYTLENEKLGTVLHDVKEFATLLNSTARYGKHDIGLNVCLGDRDKDFKKSLNLLRGHRHNLVEGLQFAREEGIFKREYVQFFHAGDGIRDTIVGIVANMLLNSEDTSNDLPIIGFANKDDDQIKASARANQSLVDRGLDLSVVLKTAASKLDGIGGGHSIAAGATIPRGKEEEFLKIVEEEIKNQLSST